MFVPKTGRGLRNVPCLEAWGRRWDRLVFLFFHVDVIEIGGNFEAVWL